MPNIQVLDQNTINKIAAGEVIDRPASVVKELLENAIDARATAITVEIKEGGISFIRITDNGSGIPASEIPLAFLRHSTSKIKSIEDLITVSSLGFRGEALSSIAAVAQVELITKTPQALTGSRYLIEGGVEKQLEEIGAPEGTTFLIRNLFFNTPARRKFLKSPVTEAGYIQDLVERIALSHPDISIRFINNNQNKIHTSGNTNLKDIIYNLFGRDITGNLLPVNTSGEIMKVDGYVGKPVIARANRTYENYFINGRYIRSSLISKAIEEAYKPYMMQHRYPFTALHLTIDPSLLDVNVHPSKMELRFRNSEEIFPLLVKSISDALNARDLIPQVALGEKKETAKPILPKLGTIPEPFEKKRQELFHPVIDQRTLVKESSEYPVRKQEEHPPASEEKYEQHIENPLVSHEEKSVQLTLFEEKLLTEEARSRHRLIGQLFDTYWLVEFDDKLFIMDQHAAHEKVLYEKTIAGLNKKEHISQLINPPVIITLSLSEETVMNKYMDNFREIGFEIEHFGGKEYAVRAVPDNLYSIAQKELLLELLSNLADEDSQMKSELINEKIASMSCKAAVKGKNKISTTEADALIDQLMKLENPYHCPHGRPTIISMSRYELEKKFKRII